MIGPALVAPDSFKGTLRAVEVAAAVSHGLREGGVEAVPLPVADGGEGTLEALTSALGGELARATVADPLGRAVEAQYALIDAREPTGVVECARASGLGLVAEAERDALAASTRGTGELIAAAAEAGARKVIVTVGGSATTDGGAGALEALDEAGVKPKLEVWCDVRTPWEAAARTFGSQKGADADTLKRLAQRLTRLAAKAPKDPRGVPMTGAAGGLAGGLWAWRGAQLVPGAPAVLNAIGFDELMRASAFVVTGEGRVDRQTFQGKAVFEVATRARQSGVACHAIVGDSTLEPFEERILDLQTVSVATTPAELTTAGRALARSVLASVE
ncbi:MAG TPA: glycerate kinase [Thermoleophilaceae bacterium]|nr:glycerate kinase [Thermoleophilaceae bacterium]